MCRPGDSQLSCSSQLPWECLNATAKKTQAHPKGPYGQHCATRGLRCPGRKSSLRVELCLQCCLSWVAASYDMLTLTWSIECSCPSCNQGFQHGGLSPSLWIQDTWTPSHVYLSLPCDQGQMPLPPCATMSPFLFFQTGSCCVV